MTELSFTDSEVHFIREKHRLNDQQLDVFIEAAKRYNMNPIANQIYPQVRQGKMTIMTGIDGYRLVADRTGKYAGNDDPVYDNEEQPRLATVTVYKIVGGERCAFTASARWDQYFPGEKQGFMWKKMPHLMLGKCAEALALRKAFPAELSGMYTEEEMQQSGKPDNMMQPPKPQREVPVQAAPADDELGRARSQFMEAVGKWAEGQETISACKKVLAALEIPTDGSADAVSFGYAYEFVQDKIDSGSSFHDVLEKKAIEESNKEVSKESEDVPW